jgi:hypothetical protein
LAAFRSSGGELRPQRSVDVALPDDSLIVCDAKLRQGCQLLLECRPLGRRHRTVEITVERVEEMG